MGKKKNNLWVTRIEWLHRKGRIAREGYDMIICCVRHEYKWKNFYENNALLTGFLGRVLLLYKGFDFNEIFECLTPRLV